jgi:hypothetical protein
MVTSDDIEVKKLAFDYAWRWFELHSNQRLQAFRFYLSIVLGIVGFGAVMYAQGEIKVLSVVGGASFTITVIFALFERRIRHLLDIGRDGLYPIERAFSEELAQRSIRLVHRAKLTPPPRITYKHVILALYASIAIASIAVFIWSIRANIGD